MQIGVLNNLRAGRSERQVSRLLEMLRSYPDVLHVETDSAGALPEAISDLARRRIDLLLVNGGDGTLQHALTEILVNEPFEKLPLVAPLRGGRTNMTAADLGASGDAVKGAKRLIEAAYAGRIAERIVDRPVLRAEIEGGRSCAYGMFFGAGMIRRAISFVHSFFPSGRSQGALGAGLVTMGLVAKTSLRPREGILTPDKLQIRLDGNEVRGGEFRLAISTTLRRLFWRLDPFWGTERGDVRFTCIASDAERFARAAPGVLWGRPPSFVSPECGYTSRNARRVELRLGCGFTLDGEIFEQEGEEIVTLSADRRLTFVRA